MTRSLVFVCLLVGCSSEASPDAAMPGGGNSAGGAATAGTPASLPSGGGGGAGLPPVAAGGQAGLAGAGGQGSAGASNPPGGAAATGTAGSAGSIGIVGGTAGAGDASDRCELAKLDGAHPPTTLAVTGSLGTHDPVVIAADGKFYLFSTGNNIGAKTSPDLLSWQGAPDVLSSNTRPAWLSQQVPGVSNLWAPDISFFGGMYHLYYSASTFGSNHSCIGHLTRASLSSGSWTDRGSVICSNVSTKDDWNAIDPNVIVDLEGAPWLAFGSFWGGIKLIKLGQDGARVGTSLDSLAARPSAGGALEAPFLVRRCGFYYLFVSWDKCCQGVSSTYNIRVGRSAAVQGPYVDQAGKAMLAGGGTLLVEGGTRYHGPGHNAVIFTEKAAYNVYHAYDGNSNGASVLRISELAWNTDGWPVSGGP